MLNSELYGNIIPSTDKTLGFLRMKFDLTENIHYHLFRNEEIKQFIFESGPENSHEEILRFFERLISLKKSALSNKVKNRIDFLLLSFSAQVVEIYNVTGHFHYCYDIFAFSILDRTFKNGEQYDIDNFRVFKHINSFDNEIEEYSKFVTIEWLGQLFYYSRSFSGLNEWGLYFLEDVMMFIDEVEEYSGEYSFLLSNLYAWCELNYKKDELKYLRNKYINLEKTITNDTNSLFAESVRFNIALTQEFESKFRKEVSQKLMSHSWVNPISKTQFLCSLYSNHLLPETTIHDVSLEIQSLILELKQDNKIDELHEKSRIAKILNVLIRHCFDNKKYEELNLILHKFFEKEDFVGPILYIVPNSIDGTKLLNQVNLHQIPHNSLTTIFELTKSRNLALNQFILMKGTEYTNQIPEGEIGTPNYKMGASFEASLDEIYNFSNIEVGFLNDSESLFQFDFNGLPLQSLFLKKIKSTLPLQESYCKKISFKKKHKILFWRGNSFSSIQEFDCVNAICEETNIVLKGIDSSKDEFYDELQSDYDIVWISSHGEHGHYDPFNSKINLNEGADIELKEYGKLINPNPSFRRLFFSNVCEGGISAQTGDLINVGFPAFITSSNQDYLSHLWMVQFNIAKIFGVLFVIHISKGLNPFDSYQKAVLNLIEGRDSVLNELSKFERLEPIKELMNSNSNLESLEFENILNWGSSAYYV